MAAKVEHGTWQRAKGHRIFRHGDRMYVHLPGRKNAVKVTFLAHVEIENGKDYLEVRDSGWRRRCIAPDAFVRGGK